MNNQKIEEEKAMKTLNDPDCLLEFGEEDQAVEGFRCFGVDNEEGMWDIVCDAKVIEQKHIGFQSEYEALEYGNAYPGGGMAYLVEHDGKYIIYADGFFAGDCIDPLYLPTVFLTFETAKMQYDNISYGLPTMKEMIAEVKRKIHDHRLWIKPKGVRGEYQDVIYQIFYDRNLIADHANLDDDYIKECIAKYKRFCKDLEKNNYELSSIEKTGGYPDNERYFEFNLWGFKKNNLYFKKHISSSLRGKPRCTLDFITIDEVLEKAEDVNKEYQRK